jgi:hypothetical protein
MNNGNTMEPRPAMSDDHALAWEGCFREAERQGDFVKIMVKNISWL